MIEGGALPVRGGIYLATRVVAPMLEGEDVPDSRHQGVEDVVGGGQTQLESIAPLTPMARATARRIPVLVLETTTELLRVGQ